MTWKKYPKIKPNENELVEAAALDCGCTSFTCIYQNQKFTKLSDGKTVKAVKWRQLK